MTASHLWVDWLIAESVCLHIKKRNSESILFIRVSCASSQVETQVRNDKSYLFVRRSKYHLVGSILVRDCHLVALIHSMKLLMGARRSLYSMGRVKEVSMLLPLWQYLENKKAQNTYKFCTIYSQVFCGTPVHTRIVTYSRC